MSDARRWLKRYFDVVIAGTLLVLLAPLLGILALLIRSKLGRPVLFRQLRPGKDGKLFELLKFRTMTDATTPDGKLLPDEERLTPFGAMLRRSSLDELPELINVLRGEMSLVGPRPLLPEYLPLYTPEQARRHEVLPGITGYAQVRGRNAISWEERFRLDLDYIDNWSLTFDLWILLLTVVKVLRRDGISAAGSVTMPRFRGQAESKQAHAGARRHEEGAK